MPAFRFAWLCLLMLALPLQGLAAARAADCLHRPGVPQAPATSTVTGPGPKLDLAAGAAAHHDHHHHHGHGVHGAHRANLGDAMPPDTTPDDLALADAPCPLAGAASAACDGADDAPCGTCAACCLAAVLPTSVATSAPSLPDAARSAPRTVAWPAVTPSPLERPPRTTAA